MALIVANYSKSALERLIVAIEPRYISVEGQPDTTRQTPATNVVHIKMDRNFRIRQGPVQKYQIGPSPRHHGATKGL